MSLIWWVLGFLVTELIDYWPKKEKFLFMNWTLQFSCKVGLDSWLLPINFPHSTEEKEELHRALNDYYRDAVKYLRLALHSETPIVAALLPLVQVLIIIIAALYH